MADSGWGKMMHRSRKRTQNQYLSILENGLKRIIYINLHQLNQKIINMNTNIMLD
jgi:hypothetical protein